MKKYYFILLLIPLIGCGQFKNGIIVYNVVSYMTNSIAEINHADMKKLSYTLKFNENASIFYVNDYPGIIDVTAYKNLLVASNCNEIYYKENKSNSHFMNINDDEFGEATVEYFDLPEWELTTESKFIANFKCYKAICYKNDFGPPGKPKTLKIIAWYCPQLSVSVRPKGLSGLPGLILETEEPTRNIIFSASSVKLNVDEKIIINRTTTGKLLSEKQYRQLVQDWIDSNYK